MAADTLLDGYDAVLLDLDGTVYQGREPIDGAAEGIAAVRAAGVPIRFVTNNASRSPAAVAQRLRDLRLDAEPSEVATSAQAAAHLLADRLPAGTTVLIVGTDALAAEVTAVGLRPTRTYAAGVDAVVQGHSPDTTWRDLAEACVAIRAGVLWVACNVDPTLPTERGQLPGNGSMVAALRMASGGTPEVAGKPAPGLFTTAAEAAGAARPLVVGDRLDTDIAGAVAANMDALLVLSGVTTAAGVLAAPEGQRPTHIAADLRALSTAASVQAVGEQPGWQVEVGEAALEVRGSGEPLALLRALCRPAWESGVHTVRPHGADAATAAKSLGLTVIDYR